MTDWSTREEFERGTEKRSFFGAFERKKSQGNFFVE